MDAWPQLVAHEQTRSRFPKRRSRGTLALPNTPDAVMSWHGGKEEVQRVESSCSEACSQEEARGYKEACGQEETCYHEGRGAQVRGCQEGCIQEEDGQEDSDHAEGDGRKEGIEKGDQEGCGRKSNTKEGRSEKEGGGQGPGSSKASSRKRIVDGCFSGSRLWAPPPRQHDLSPAGLLSGQAHPPRRGLCKSRRGCTSRRRGSARAHARLGREAPQAWTSLGQSQGGPSSSEDLRSRPSRPSATCPESGRSWALSSTC